MRVKCFKWLSVKCFLWPLHSIIYSLKALHPFSAILHGFTASMPMLIIQFWELVIWVGCASVIQMVGVRINIKCHRCNTVSCDSLAKSCLEYEMLFRVDINLLDSLQLHMEHLQVWSLMHHWPHISFPHWIPVRYRFFRPFVCTSTSTSVHANISLGSSEDREHI